MISISSSYISSFLYRVFYSQNNMIRLSRIMFWSILFPEWDYILHLFDTSLCFSKITLWFIYIYIYIYIYSSVYYYYYQYYCYYYYYCFSLSCINIVHNVSMLSPIIGVTCWTQNRIKPNKPNIQSTWTYAKELRGSLCSALIYQSRDR